MNAPLLKNGEGIDAKVLTLDEARRIAVNIATLPVLRGAVLKAEEA